jgi:hypothetical protein
MLNDAMLSVVAPIIMLCNNGTSGLRYKTFTVVI